jgi:hypothetical protein
MKKILSIAVLSALALGSCTKMPEYVEVNPNQPTEEEIRKNNESIFGTIDPNQDWNMFSSGSITILADAPLDNVAKVQVLTESPFFNDNARVLSEAKANKGDEVTLVFDAPYDLTRLIAACVDSNGKYYVKGFDLGTKKVSFTSSTASTRAMTRGAYGFPNIPKLTATDSYFSYNAGRTQNANSGSADFSAWKGKGWENERLWGKTDGVYKSAVPITTEEVAELRDLFSVSLQRTSNGNSRVRDNMKYINESPAVQFFDNHLISDGVNPIIVTPVNLISTEAYMCDLYYYYYKDEDIPSGMSKTEYIKQLPKFKAANMNTEREAFKAISNIDKNKNDTSFLKIHDYLLPYYGDPSQYKATKTSLASQGYVTDGKFYRIRCTDLSVYITHTGNADNLKAKYEDSDANIAYQVFQLFIKDGNKVILYNVGAGNFFMFIPGGYPTFTSGEADFNYFCFNLKDKSNNALAADAKKENVHIFNYNDKYVLKSDAGKKVASDANNKNDRATIQWTFEEYTPSATLASVSDATIDIWPTTYPTPSEVFDQGYNIGIMLRKGRDKTIDSSKLTHSKNGCLYSYGELNKEINSFGDFNNAVTKYSMKLNSPRIALCQANNKSYLTFEDGSDTNFGDIIIETKSGVEEIPQEKFNVEYMSYMMCFEDSPLADYDLNDVVLKFQRDDDTHVTVTLTACGAYDDLYLRGLNGNVLNGNTEIHELMGADPQTYVNTEANKFTGTVSETFSINADTPIWQFMKQVYIYDKTTETEIRLSEQGQSPCAIIVPGNIAYPLEKVNITTAYPDFKAWVNNATENRNWYENVEEKNVYKVE